MKAELVLPNYATKADSENTTGVDTWTFVEKVGLVSLKSEVDKQNIG